MSASDPNLRPILPRADHSPVTDKILQTSNVYISVIILILIFLVSLYAMNAPNGAWFSMGLWGISISIIGVIIALTGLTSIQPNESVVCLLFGAYVGTEHRPGLRWLNPFYSRKRVSRRLRSLECGPLKVNDAIGNPIEISAVVIWRVQDAAKALLEVASYEDYVKAQSETALRRMASVHPYDDIEIEEAAHRNDAFLAGRGDREGEPVLTLRDGGDRISENLLREIRSKMEPIGVRIEEARISHLAYSSEIASAMLRRQAAGAVVAARRLVVKGAVSIVEEALRELEQKGIGENLDPERKAAMISNLLVVLVGDRDVSPVIDAGSLYLKNQEA